MTANRSFESAWQAYRQTVDELYSAPEGIAATADRSAGDIYAERLVLRGDAVLMQAEEVRITLVENMQIEDFDQRELAALKMLASAAYDLAVANDLLELEQTAPSDERERSARNVVLASNELRSVLDAPFAGGVSGLLEVERAVLPNKPEAARAKLEDTIAQFLQTIPSSASALCQSSVSGMINLGLGPAQGALSVVSQEILSRVPEGLSFVARRAAGLIVEAIRKLRSAIGVESEQQIQEHTAAWLKDIQENHDTVASLLDRLYETGRIGEEVSALLAAAPGTTAAARYNQATKTLEELIARYGKTKGVLEWVMRAIALVKTPLMGAVPWGPLAVYGSYLGIIGYAIYSGGDYLDWYRTGESGWLDRVQGIRTTVRQALETAEKQD